MSSVAGLTGARGGYGPAVPRVRGPFGLWLVTGAFAFAAVVSGNRALIAAAGALIWMAPRCVPSSHGFENDATRWTAGSSSCAFRPLLLMLRTWWTSPRWTRRCSRAELLCANHLVANAEALMIG